MLTKSKRGGVGLLANFSNASHSFLAKGSTYNASAWEKRLMTTALGLAMMQQTMAQGGTAAALSGVQETIITIVQILFSIILVIGLIRVVMKFVNGNPDALSALGWLVGGVILWFGFQFFKDDLVGTVGGEGGVR
ncbi:hypothetical protein [Adhaeribacter rhizoryzae]|uniref:DUF4134 domain-containing protein n=1 Tax=Adhaeribacter rhizoryzae TaxID=2607907 RepID=A0A5M6CWQ1_9BACT|nr:hypothetical protein [Adhaeribacter rhizoryzae]KAA5539644.1 hypothetical protein F0145_23955 [Adhaeribacter rhizoryzae]